MALPQIRAEIELTAGVWTDITGDVLHDDADGGAPVEIGIGRQTELDDIEPTRITLALRNSSGKYTPGNALSPYYPNWGQGRRIRITEIVGGVDHVLATGYLEVPDVTINVPDVDQPAPISAVDRIAAIGSAPALESLLTEHILLGADDTGLREYFPLTDDAPPLYSGTTSGYLTRALTVFEGAGLEPEDLVVLADKDGPPGDDGRYPTWSYYLDDGSVPGVGNLTGALSVPVGATDTISVSAWLWAKTPPAGTEDSRAAISMGGTDGAGNRFYLDMWDSGAHDFVLSAQEYHDGGFTVVSSGRVLETEAWRLVTVQYDRAAATLAIWIGRDLVVSEAVTGVPSGAVTFDYITVGQLWEGSIGHVQIRVGGPAVWTLDDHIAQHNLGWEGLHRQTVAERIATIAGFAGIDPAGLNLPAAASTPMQVARVAGENPADLMRDAANTGGDLLITEPTGEITLIPRGRRYNQAVDAAIPYGWLSFGLRYRPDQPISDVRVSRTGGGFTRRRDRARAAQYGARSASWDLDTAIAADVGALADWAISTFDSPRVRCPSIRINMGNRTDAEKALLIGIRVGDRIQITGRPADAPEGAGDLIVQGIKHTITVDTRMIEFNTSPLLGPSPGAPPVCAVVGSSTVSDTTLIAY